MYNVKIKVNIKEARKKSLIFAPNYEHTNDRWSWNMN